MQSIGRWMARALAACVVASVGACGGSSSSDGDSDSNDSGSSGNSGGSGGSSSSNGSNGSSNGTSSGTVDLVPGTPTDIEDYYGEASGVVCEWLAPCCEAFGLQLSAGSCSTNIEAGFAADFASADPDNYTYDPDLAGDCLATARKLYDNLGCELEEANISPAVNETCERVFTGKLEPGAPCAATIECAAEPGDRRECTSLDFEDDEATVCVIERRAAEGESCYWTCTKEGALSFCSGSGPETPALQGQCHTSDQLYCVDGVCARQPTLGESCAGNATCHEGYCLNDICVPAGESGDPCQSDVECSDNLYCEGTACAPLKPEGEPCESSTECQSGSCNSEEGCASPGDFPIALLCAVASGEL